MTDPPTWPGRPAALPVSLVGLPPTDPQVCEINAGVDHLGIVHADLTSEDPAVVERRAR